jgi:hypothetical protein
MDLTIRGRTGEARILGQGTILSRAGRGQGREICQGTFMQQSVALLPGVDIRYPAPSAPLVPGRWLAACRYPGRDGPSY